MEDGILRKVRLRQWEAWAGLQLRERCARSITASIILRQSNSRPHLRALLRYDGEAYLLLAKLEPCERTERVERRRQFYVDQLQSMRYVVYPTRKGIYILY